MCITRVDLFKNSWFLRNIQPTPHVCLQKNFRVPLGQGIGINIKVFFLVSVNYGSGISRVRLIRVRLVLVNLNSSYIFCSFFITKLLHTKLRPKMTGGRVFQKSQKISIIWAGTSLSRPTLEPKIRTPESGPDAHKTTFWPRLANFLSLCQFTAWRSKKFLDFLRQQRRILVLGVSIDQQHEHSIFASACWELAFRDPRTQWPGSKKTLSRVALAA